MTKEDMVDAVRDYIDGEGYRYEYDAEHQMLKLGFTLKCKLKNVRLFWEFTDKGYIVYSVSPINADKDNLGEMAKYLHMANYGLINGNFELDYRDGEVRYKCHVCTDGLDSVSKEILERSLDVGIAMMNRYGDGIAALALGFSDADAEIKKIEGEA